MNHTQSPCYKYLCVFDPATSSLCLCDRGSGWMNHTQSPCYKCQCLTCPTRILPPTKPRQQKKRTEHSCTGANCYNRAVPLGPVPTDGGARGSRGGERGGRRGRGYQRGGDGFGGGYYDPGDDDGKPRVYSCCFLSASQPCSVFRRLMKGTGACCCNNPRPPLLLQWSFRPTV